MARAFPFITKQRAKSLQEPAVLALLVISSSEKGKLRGRGGRGFYYWQKRVITLDERIAKVALSCFPVLSVSGNVVWIQNSKS